MNSILKNLASIIRDNPWQKKQLVVASMAAGYQLLEGLAREGVSWLNIRPITPSSLAREIIKDEIKHYGLSELSRTQTLYILDQIFVEMNQQQELVYFKAIYDMGVLSNMLLPSIRDLRLAGIKASNINADDFVDLKKGQEIIRILASYEQALEAGNVIDEAELFFMAQNKIQNSTHLEKKIILIPQQLDCSYASYCFLTSLNGRGALVLPEEPVLSLNTPFQFRMEPKRISPVESSLSYLYSIESAPPPTTEVEIFEAYGETNEVREVLRRIIRKGLAYDQVLFSCTNEKTYVPLIYVQTLNLGIPVTFNSGLPVKYTAPGKLLYQLLHWIGSDYSALTFYRMLIGQDMKISGALPIAKYFRTLGMKCSRARYLKRLNDELIRLNKELHGVDPVDTQRQERVKKKIQQAANLRDLVTHLFELIPDTDSEGKVDTASYLNGIGEIIDKYARVQNEYDGQARQVIVERLQELQIGCPTAMLLEDCLYLVEQSVIDARIGSCSPQPGYLHVSGIDNCSWISRANTFVLGMDAAKIEGKTSQDPVLLDCEREKLSSNLKLKGEDPFRRIYSMTRFLASCRSSITLSFSSFDVVDCRPSLPSSVLLQVYRLLSHDQHLDYSDFAAWLKTSWAYVPASLDNALSDSEWWLVRLTEGNQTQIASSEVLQYYPGLAQGKKATDEREGQALCEYDGKIDELPEILDPRHNSKKILSATTIETIAKCPFRYFIQYVLGIEQPEELTPDSDIWLSAADRGSLLHSVYCEYQREIFKNGNNRVPDKQLLLKIAEFTINSWRDVIPPPDERVYEMEKGAMIAGLEVFWVMHNMECQQKDVIPSYFEMPFGLGIDAVTEAGYGLPNPVSITLPSGKSILLRGKIDRVDCTPSMQSYQVWDFKTGGARDYSERDFVKQGQQVQHVLYALAAEEIIKLYTGSPKVIVDKAGYLFPTIKGEGERIERNQSIRERGLQALDAALDIVGEGVFCATSNINNCTFCDFQAVCRAPWAAQASKRRLDEGPCSAMLKWEALQKYE